MKQWILSRNKYIILVCAYLLLTIASVLLIPVYSARLFEYLPKETHNFLLYLNFVDVFIAVCVIVYLASCAVMLFFCLLLYFNIIKARVTEIMCYIAAGALLVLFAAAIRYYIMLDGLSFSAGGYLLLVWAAGFVAIGIAVRPMV